MKERLIELFDRLDSITYNHSVRVMQLAREVEQYYGLPDRKLSDAALLHDIGKVYISHKILDKPDLLTDLERSLVNLHPYIGFRLLEENGIDPDICSIVLFHHGFNPPVLETVSPAETDNIYDKALLLHSIDAFEALTSDRPYHRGFLATEALDIMLKEKRHHQAFLDFLIELTDKKEGWDSKSTVFRNNSFVDRRKIESVLRSFEGVPLDNCDKIAV